MVRTTRAVDSIHGERKDSILGAGQGQGSPKEYGVRGRPTRQRCLGIKALHSFKNKDKEVSGAEMMFVKI